MAMKIADPQHVAELEKLDYDMLFETINLKKNFKDPDDINPSFNQLELCTESHFNEGKHRDFAIAYGLTNGYVFCFDKEYTATL